MIDFKIFEFKINLTGPLREKKGILLYARDEFGKKAFSEVSPLPGFSRETLDDAKRQLIDLTKSICTLPFSEIEKIDMFPSVAFGLDSLFFSLSNKTILSEKHFPLCALISGTFDEMKNQIFEALKNGYQCIKLKIAQLSFEEAHRLIDLLIGKIPIKIDLNRTWSLETALCFFSRYKPETFQYIEEPLKNLEDLVHFPYPVALDETLRDDSVSISSNVPIKALVVKPMMLGGVKAFKKIQNLSNHLNAPIILSSSYESGVGLFHICSWMERTNIPLHPLGLDTYRFIKNDLIEKPHTLSQGNLILSPIEIDSI